MILEVGRVCVKVKGKDAGKHCVVVEKPEKNMVLVDGKRIERKKVNILHLEPTPTLLNIPKGAKTEEVAAALEKEGY